MASAISPITVTRLTSSQSSAPSGLSSESFTTLDSVSALTALSSEPTAVLFARSRNWYITCNPTSYLAQCTTYSDTYCDDNGNIQTDDQPCSWFCICNAVPAPPPPAPSVTAPALKQCTWYSKKQKLLLTFDCYDPHNYNRIHDSLREDEEMEMDSDSVFQNQDDVPEQQPEPETMSTELQPVGFDELSYKSELYDCDCTKDDCVDWASTYTVRAPQMSSHCV